MGKPITVEALKGAESTKEFKYIAQRLLLDGKVSIDFVHAVAQKKVDLPGGYALPGLCIGVKKQLQRRDVQKDVIIHRAFRRSHSTTRIPIDPGLSPKARRRAEVELAVVS